MPSQTAAHAAMRSAGRRFASWRVWLLLCFWGGAVSAQGGSGAIAADPVDVHVF